MSSVSQSKSIRANSRVANRSPSDSQVPNVGLPSLSARLTGLVFIGKSVRCEKRVAMAKVSSVSNRRWYRKPRRCRACISRGNWPLVARRGTDGRKSTTLDKCPPPVALAGPTALRPRENALRPKARRLAFILVGLLLVGSSGCSRAGGASQHVPPAIATSSARSATREPRRIRVIRFIFARWARRPDRA